MPQQISVGGVYLPGALLLLLMLLPLFWWLDMGLARLGLYRWAMHPSMVRIALFGLIYSACTLVLWW